MKTKTRITTFLIAMAMASSVMASDPQNADAYKVDPAASKVVWHASKVTGEHTGGIQLSEGMLTVAGKEITGGMFVIDMSSITCTDLTDADLNQKLVGHLKSDDFFGVDKHPHARLEITGSEHTSGNEYMLEGNITIKGITHPVTFPAEINMRKDGLSASTKMKLDRSKFDIRFRSGSFFDNLGDKLIYDEFELNIALVGQLDNNL